MQADRAEQPLGKLAICMGELPEQANAPTDAVVYGRIMESPDVGGHFQVKVKSPIGLEGRCAWRKMMGA